MLQTKLTLAHSWPAALEPKPENMLDGIWRNLIWTLRGGGETENPLQPTHCLFSQEKQRKWKGLLRVEGGGGGYWKNQKVFTENDGGGGA